MLGNNILIKDIPQEERPRERLLRYGAQVLSDAELLAVLIRTGTRSESALVLAQRILKGDGGKSGLTYVIDATVEELSKIKGIGTAKAVQIKAAVELGRRISSYRGRQQVTITSPLDVKRSPHGGNEIFGKRTFQGYFIKYQKSRDINRRYIYRESQLLHSPSPGGF